MVCISILIVIASGHFRIGTDRIDHVIPASVSPDGTIVIEGDAQLESSRSHALERAGALDLERHASIAFKERTRPGSIEGMDQLKDRMTEDDRKSFHRLRNNKTHTLVVESKNDDRKAKTSNGRMNNLISSSSALPGMKEVPFLFLVTDVHQMAGEALRGSTVTLFKHSPRPLIIICVLKGCKKDILQEMAVKPTNVTEISLQDLFAGGALSGWFSDDSLLVKLTTREHFQGILHAAAALALLEQESGIYVDAGVDWKTSAQNILHHQDVGSPVCLPDDSAIVPLLLSSQNKKPIASAIESFKRLYSKDAAAHTALASSAQSLVDCSGILGVARQPENTPSSDSKSHNAQVVRFEEDSKVMYAAMGYGSKPPNSIFNLGDEMQALAAVQWLPRVDLILDRDRLSALPRGGKKVVLFMNAWYGEPSMMWPPHEDIAPVPVAMHFEPEVRQKIFEHTTYLSHISNATKPIGARDTDSLHVLQSYGIPSVFAGCMTLTFQNLWIAEPRLEHLCIDAKGLPGSPETDFRHLVPAGLRENFRKCRTQDLSPNLNQTQRYARAQQLLRDLATAKLVVTSRIHVAMPCVAVGTPVIFLSANPIGGSRTRLSGLTSLFHTFDLRSTADREKLRQFRWESPPPNPHPERHRELVRILFSTITEWEPIFAKTMRVFPSAEDDVSAADDILEYGLIMGGQGWAADDRIGDDPKLHKIAGFLLDQPLNSCAMLIGFVFTCMGVPRLYDYYTGSKTRAVFVGDVIVWYAASSLYISACVSAVKGDTNWLHLLLISMVQVGSGGIFAFAADKNQLFENMGFSASSPYILCAGSAYFLGSLYALDALRFGSVALVASIRSLEALSTCGIMALSGSLEITRTQACGIALAVAGAFMTAFDKGGRGTTPDTGSTTSIAISHDSMVAICLLLLSNIMYSTRNVVTTQSELKDTSKVTIFAGQCILGLSLGLLATLSCLVMYPKHKRDIATAWKQIDKMQLLISSLCFVCYNLASFNVLVKVKPINHAVLLCGKRVFTVLLACILLHQVPGWMTLWGLVITFGGMVLHELSTKQSEAVRANKALAVKSVRIDLCIALVAVSFILMITVL